MSEEKQTILRNRLATDRTSLANERTFLAYVRTSLAFLVVGASCFKFFETGTMEVLGGLFILSGVAILLFGIRRARQVNQRIKEAYSTREPDSNGEDE